jgi:hypothetical protein
VANLKFGIALRDPPTIGKSLTKLCALSTAQTWTLITLPNIPVWPAGNFSLVPGNAGYIFTICLAAGSTLTAPANDTWQNANVFGALGQDNFAGQAVNSTFDIAFIQHEPGAPTTPMDLDFDTNLSRCQRYFTKSYPYSVQPGSVSSVGQVRFWSVAGFAPNNMHVPFKRTLAKAPTTITGYSSTTGVANTLRDEAAGADKTITSAQAVGDSAFGGFAVTSPNAANWYGSFQYTADTGW